MTRRPSTLSAPAIAFPGPAFNQRGGKSKPRYAQMTVCWADSEKKAWETAHKIWLISAMAGPLLSELALPAHFQEAAGMLNEDDIAKSIVCGPDPQKHMDELKRYVDAGFDHVYVHQIGPDQEGCIRFYEKEILPHTKKKAA